MNAVLKNTRPRRLAAPLFALAVLLLWLCYALPTWLLPMGTTSRELRHYPWPEGAAQAVRRVVIEPLDDSNYPLTKLEWSDTQPPEVVTRERGNDSGNDDDENPPAYRLQVEGDTLYIRANPRAVHARDRYTWPYNRDIESITLPMQVTEVLGRSLRLESSAKLPALTLRALNIRVDGAEIGQLDIDATHVAPEPAKPAPDGDKPKCKAPESDITINARHLGALRIHAPGGNLKLKHIGHLEAVPVRAPESLWLELPIAERTRVQWQPQPEEARPCNKAEED